MKTIRIITSDWEKGNFWQEEEFDSIRTQDCMHVINLHPKIRYQTIRGFGAALTESAAHIYSLMGEKHQKEIIEDCFGKDGLGYRLARVHMNSCDFSLGNYCYVEENDKELKTFDVSRDEKEILPFIRACGAAAGELSLLMSPWSPPAFMKDNKDMNHGGKLLPEYYEAWASYYVKFIEAYRKRGADIRWLTVQNEPMAVQTWDSCIYTAEEEGDFVRDYLGPALEKAGLLSEVKIFVWDHNKEEAYVRMRDTLLDEKTSSYISGQAVHWYTGDHFEEIEMVRKMYPDKEVFFTEGCVEYSRFADSGEIEKAEMYAHDILGNLNAGISASFDWNILLDAAGGPNHVGNYCAAPVMCDYENDTYEKRLSYYYIGHFSRYVKPGAVRIGNSRYTDKLEATAFLNPDGERVLVLLNRSNEDMEFTVREEGQGISQTIKKHTIKTILYH